MSRRSWSSSSSREIERKILRLLHGCKSRTQLPQIHAHFLRHGLHQFNTILSHFVSVCGSLNAAAYASSVFRQKTDPDIYLFNAMIKGYSLCGPFEESFRLFASMKHRGIWPDEYTFPPLLKACSALCDVKVGTCIHKEVVACGFECFSSIRIGVIEFYTAFGVMEEAEKLFDEMCYRDVIIWNLMIRGFCKKGDVEMGLYLFNQMRERSVVSWNIMISGLAKSGRDSEAFCIFHQMRDQRVEPDEATVVTVLPICARLGAVDVGQQIQSRAESSGLFRDFVSVGNALVDFHCKLGNLETARRIFRDMPEKSVVSWNTMISGLAYNGQGRLGIELFERMLNEGTRPSDSTFVGVLSCCAHAGMVERGWNLFNSMSLHHQIEPKLEHYGCMVDLLGRVGCVREAYDLMRRMPVSPNAALWGSLLSACRTHGHVDLAQRAVRELVDLEQWNSANYVLLSNMYAEEERWDEVEKIREVMKVTGVNKAPGQSAVG